MFNTVLNQFPEWILTALDATENLASDSKHALEPRTIRTWINHRPAAAPKFKHTVSY